MINLNDRSKSLTFQQNTIATRLVEVDICGNRSKQNLNYAEILYKPNFKFGPNALGKFSMHKPNTCLFQTRITFQRC